MSKMTKAIAALGVVAGLGVAALPLSSYADGNATVDVTAVVPSGISISAVNANGAQEVDFGTVALDGKVATRDITVTATGNVAGYKIAMNAVGGDTALTQINDADPNLPLANAATISTTDLTGTTSGWAYRTDTNGAWNQIPEEATAISEAGAAEAGSIVLPVQFGIKVVSGQEPGTYKGGVVFTAVAE